MAETEAGDDAPSDSRATWGPRLLAVLSLGLAVTASWAWIEVAYRGVPVTTQLSYAATDGRFASIPPTKAEPIIGVHYFSDFQLPLARAINLRHSISPYTAKRSAQYPPVSKVPFLLLSYLPLEVAAFIYLAVSAAVFLVPLWLLLAPASWEARVVFLAVAGVLTTGFVSFMDRGNAIGLTVGLVAWALLAWKHERWVWCGALLVAAISLKVSPAGLLVVPLALRRYRFTIWVVASTVTANLIALLLYPGSYLHNLREVVPSLTGYRFSPSSWLASWSIYSVVPKTVGLLFGRDATDALVRDPGSLTALPALAFLAALFFIVRRARVPEWCWGVLALASLQLLTPVSFMYTTAWAAVGAVWFARGPIIGLPDDGEPHTALRVLVLLLLVATLTPSVFTMAGVEGFRFPVTMYLSPMLVLVTTVAAVVASVRPTREPALR